MSHILYNIVQNLTGIFKIKVHENELHLRSKFMRTLCKKRTQTECCYKSACYQQHLFSTILLQTQKVSPWDDCAEMYTIRKTIYETYVDFMTTMTMRITIIKVREYRWPKSAKASYHHHHNDYQRPSSIPTFGVRWDLSSFSF